MAEVKKARLFLRRGTDTDRKTTTLCQGELGYSTDAFRVFVGDGSTAGGNTLGMMAFVSAGVNFQTNLTEASAAGLALSGDIAVFPSSNWTNAGGGTDAIDSSHATTVMLLTGSNPATASHWVNINNNIPFGNISLSADDISGNYVSGGIISGPITLSGGNVSLGGDGNGDGDSVFLPGVALSAATVPTGDLVYPLGLTSTSQITCVNSILDFGVPTTSSGLGNPGGYMHANPSSVSDHISAYAISSSAYTFGTTTVQGTSGGTSGTTHNNGGSGIATFTDYIKSGGAYATGSATPIIPDGWSYTGGLGGLCGIFEVVFDQAKLRLATGENSLTFAQIQEFYFTAFYTHYDDAASFVGYHDHLTDQNVIADWNGSSIGSGKMRAVPHVNQICIPNTYNASDAASQHVLVLHLGVAAVGKLAIVFNGLRVNVG